MKIYHANNSLVVEGTRQSYPEKSLRASNDGNLVTVWLSDNETKVLETEYSNIQSENGMNFANVGLAVAYLATQFEICSIESRIEDLEQNTDGLVNGADPLSYYILAKGN